LNNLSTTTMTLPSDTEIVFTRTFNAPRTLVWDVWTQCEHLKNWWGPAEWELPTCEMDLRVGGHWKYCMRGPMPDGKTMESCGMATYQEIIAPEKLVYTDDFVDADFNPVEGMPQAQITVTFEEVDGKTVVTNTTRYNNKAERDSIIEMGVEAGTTQMLDGLDTYLASIA
jgi:uncharacterized protein YndB with AHSA1/START domain